MMSWEQQERQARNVNGTTEAWWFAVVSANWESRDGARLANGFPA